jgi:NAD(P)-dependent dehydrogenase (short-subunit alcohol dehydrogenase family)
VKKEKWTTANMPDLKEKVIIVTGGNSGLGYESVKAFAQNGAEVILTSRSVEKGEAAKAEILKDDAGAKIVVMQLDLMDLTSINHFVTQFQKFYERLDVLMNNAGIMMVPYALTKDGFESQMGTNHLGHFALTGLLLDLLIKTPGSRVVNVSSNAHKWGKMDFENLLFKEGADYSPTKSYGRSKLSNLLFTYELERRLKKSGNSTIAVAAHPGGSRTNLASHFERKWWFKLLTPLFVLMTQDQAQGALPQIRASVDPEVKGGDYYGPNGYNEIKGDPVLVQSNEASHNEEDAKKLWKASENLTGVNYKF